MRDGADAKPSGGAKRRDEANLEKTERRDTEQQSTERIDAENKQNGHETERRRKAPAQRRLANTKQSDTKRQNTERSDAALRGRSR